MSEQRSETPLTDDNESEMKLHNLDGCVSADFARKLELRNRRLAEALKDCIMAIGSHGANYDLTHPHRKVWEAARAALNESKED